LSARLQDLGGARLHAARAKLISFDGYIRPGEVLGIHTADVYVTRKEMAYSYPTIAVTICEMPEDSDEECVATTNTGETDDTVVFGDAASIKGGRSFAAELLAALKEKAPSPHNLPFPIALAQHEELHRKANVNAGLTKLRAPLATEDQVLICCTLSPVPA
jgi:hypothetical protein